MSHFLSSTCTHIHIHTYMQYNIDILYGNTHVQIDGIRAWALGYTLDPSFASFGEDEATPLPTLQRCDSLVRRGYEHLRERKRRRCWCGGEGRVDEIRDEGGEEGYAVHFLYK